MNRGNCTVEAAVLNRHIYSNKAYLSEFLCLIRRVDSYFWYGIDLLSWLISFKSLNIKD